MYSKIALSIGGSDSGGGAGIQADLRTFMALKVHGCSVITCITAQNSLEVTCVEPVEKNTLISQLDTLFSDYAIDSLKTGMLLNGKMTMPATIEVIEFINRKTLLKVILREGRNRQIRKIATLIGHPVQDLQRISISNINLNGLQEGKWRELKKEEWISIINKTICILWL